MTAEIERRLTNILSADIFGYSRLMGLDEAGTLATLNAYRTAMTDSQPAGPPPRSRRATNDGTASW